jgi:hypothetical protein
MMPLEAGRPRSECPSVHARPFPEGAGLVVEKVHVHHPVELESAFLTLFELAPEQAGFDQ